jgi:excisionase family DNA binding protein
MLTPPVVAQRLGVSADKVLYWIKEGSLRAVNVALRVGGRPRWRIAEADLAAFETARLATVPPALRRRKCAPMDVIEFF